MKINKKFLASGLCLAAIVGLCNLSFASTGTVNTELVRVRESASTSAKIVKNLTKDTSVEVVETEGDWYKVKSGDSTGYVYKDYLNVVEDALDNSENSAANVTNADNTAEGNVQEGTAAAEGQEVVENNTEATQEVQTKTIGNKLNSDSKIYLLPTLSSSKIASATKDSEVKVISTVNNWSNVEVGEYNGWVPNQKLFVEVASPETPAPSEETPAEESKEEEKEEEKVEETPADKETAINKNGYVNTASANMRSGPSTSTNAIAGLIENEVVYVISEKDNWYQVRTTDNMTGYVSKPLVTIGTPVTSRSAVDRKALQTAAAIESANSAQTTTATTTATSAPASTTVSSGSGSSVVSTAQSYVGSAYVYGASGPSSFDCSGFTSYVYAQNGVKISRTADTQANEGVAVDKSNLQAGDLVYFNNGGNGSIGHVGIYIGNGQFIHAANPRRGVTYDTINSGYYCTYYAGARRIV